MINYYPNLWSYFFHLDSYFVEYTSYLIGCQLASKDKYWYIRPNELNMESIKVRNVVKIFFQDQNERELINCSISHQGNFLVINSGNGYIETTEYFNLDKIICCTNTYTQIKPDDYLNDKI